MALSSCSVLAFVHLDCILQGRPCGSGSEIKPAFTLNVIMRVRISKWESKIFVQDNFCQCKSIDQNIESNLPVCEIIQSMHKSVYFV